MKNLILSALAVVCTSLSFGQNFMLLPDFEDNPPFREMQCGLWINAAGDIAYKDIGCELDEEEGTWIDSLTFIPDLKPCDYFITWAYDVREEIPDDISDDDFTLRFMPELKNVVDTVSFRILSMFYFVDKKHVYFHQVMACGGHIAVAHGVDRKTFKAFDENPDYARDKRHCYAVGRDIEGADPKTFEPIINEEYSWYSRDKNHVYDMNERMSDEEIAIAEKELGIRLRK